MYRSGLHFPFSGGEVPWDCADCPRPHRLSLLTEATMGNRTPNLCSQISKPWRYPASCCHYFCVVENLYLGLMEPVPLFVEPGQNTLSNKSQMEEHLVVLFHLILGACFNILTQIKVFMYIHSLSTSLLSQSTLFIVFLL